MPRKPRYLSHNISTQPLDNETLNKLQSPWFPFSYGSHIDGDQNSSANTDSAQFSASNSNFQDSLLQSKNGGHKRKPDAVVQNNAENHQHHTRNVRSHVQLPASQCLLPNNGSTSVKLPTTSEGKLRIENLFSQSKNLHRKRKPPNLGGSHTQKNETVPRNIRQCLESAGICHGEGDTCCDLHIGNISSITYHVGSQYSDPSLQHKRPFSAQSMPLMANEATHDLNSVSDVSHCERVRGSTGGRTHNVRQRLRAANLVNTFASPPIPPVQGPTVLPNPDTTPSYEDLGDCDQRCRHYGAPFWYKQRHTQILRLEVHKQRYEDADKEKIRNRYPLAILLQQNSKSCKVFSFVFGDGDPNEGIEQHRRKFGRHAYVGHMRIVTMSKTFNGKRQLREKRRGRDVITFHFTE